MNYRPIARIRKFLHHHLVVNSVRIYYQKVWGMRIGVGSRISRSVRLDKTNPSGVVIGDFTAIAFEASVLTHDYVNGIHKTTTIGSNCFIGARAVIMPGVTIGDHCVVATGSVVMRNVPPRSLVMGNPARVMQQGLETGPYGILRNLAAAPSENSAAAISHPA